MAKKSTTRKSKVVKGEQLKLVAVVWEDAIGQGGWVKQADYNEITQIPQLTLTVGILLEDEKDRIVTCQTKTDGAVGDVMKIPRGMVRSFSVLRVVAAPWEDFTSLAKLMNGKKKNG